MVRRLCEGVWLLELGLVPPLASNAYLVDERRVGGDEDGVTDIRADGGTETAEMGDDGESHGSDLTLVDTGLWWNEPSIGDELGALGYEAADIDRVLLTHYDLDHVGGLNRLVPAFDGPVYVGSEDLALLDGRLDPQWLHHKGLFHRASRRLFPLPDLDVRPLSDGDTVGGFTAYHTPGHNPGHVAYYHEAASTAFLGDLVWSEEGALTTPFWGDSYDMDRLRASVGGLADRLPDFSVAAMGHGDPLVTGGSDALRTLARRVS
ncbi:MBL fold metallo-hydrolase [Haloarcula marina]|uniref:MBL fold metallo-hydrolase n=1 Tax=Haloarcula marina TaxID=2961574 RepID=UPI0020B7FA36|nr:MBL fold metallo-hydrolase [Halomicroarcula marina]